VMNRKCFRMINENWKLSIGQISSNPGHQTSATPLPLDPFAPLPLSITSALLPPSEVSVAAVAAPRLP
jgi:hypothetical protein